MFQSACLESLGRAVRPQRTGKAEGVEVLSVPSEL